MNIIFELEEFTKKIKTFIEKKNGNTDDSKLINTLQNWAKFDEIKSKLLKNFNTSNFLDKNFKMIEVDSFENENMDLAKSLEEIKKLL